jgi:hypothetical protein
MSNRHGLEKNLFLESHQPSAHPALCALVRWLYERRHGVIHAALRAAIVDYSSASVEWDTIVDDVVRAINENPLD